jgi:hypothetical protein
MESMRSTWTDSRLDDFTVETGRRFDKVDGELREIRSELGALQRTIIGVGGGLIAAVMGVIATQL